MRDYDHEIFDSVKHDQFGLFIACGFESIEEVALAINKLRKGIYDDMSLRILSILLVSSLMSLPSIFTYLIVYPGLYDDITEQSITKVIESIEHKLRYLLETGKKFVLDSISQNIDSFVSTIALTYGIDVEDFS